MASSVSLRAATCMTIAMTFFATMGIFIRLSSETLHTLEIVFFRNALALVFFIPFIAKNGLTIFRSTKKKLYGVRALINVSGMAAGFTAITMIPLAEATALSFTAPLFATFAAALVLGETIRMRRIIALTLGFLGMLLILQPGVNEISTGSILALINALTIAITVLIVKKLTTTERPEIIVIYMALFQTPLALIPAIFFWHWPDFMTWVWLVALATAGTLGHLLYTKAIQLAEVSQMQPIEFIRLPMVAALAFFLFGEVPTYWTWLGGAIIFAATAYVTHREAKLSRS